MSKVKLWNPLTWKKSKTTKTTTAETVESLVETYGHYIDMDLYIANKAADLLLGNGVTIRGDETYGKDRLLSIWDKNGIEGLLRTSEMNLSMRIKGNQLWIVQPNYDNDIVVNLVNMDGSTIIGNQGGKILHARTVIDYYDGAFNYSIRQTWKNGVMKTSINLIGENNQESAIDVNEFNRKTGEKFLESWVYGDLQPLVMFTNKTTAGITDAGDGVEVRNLQYEIDTLFYMNNREAIYNKTLILTDRLAAEVKGGTSRNVAEVEELIVNVTSKKDSVQYLQGAPVLGTYLDAIDKIIDKRIAGAHYSVADDYAGVDTQVGVMFKGKDDRETTKIKKDTREKNLEDLINSIVEIDKNINIDVYGNEQYNVVIEAFNVLEAGEEDARVEKLMELGLITERDIIRHYYGLDNDEAEIDRIIEELKNEEKIIDVRGESVQVEDEEVEDEDTEEE